MQVSYLSAQHHLYDQTFFHFEILDHHVGPKNMFTSKQQKQTHVNTKQKRARSLEPTRSTEVDGN